MTSISAVNSTLQTALVPVSATPLAQSDAGASTTPDTSTPAAVVTLGQNTSIGYAETYTSRGAVAGGDTKVVQESEGYNKVTYAMLGNLDSSSTSTRFRGVGAALMQQLAEGKSTSISQSLLKGVNSSDTAAVTSAQSDLHTKSANTFSLTLKMASGATVTLSLAGGSRGLAVQADVSGGKLNSEELNALGALSDSFQNTIDGLSSVPPSLKLGDLAKLDPNMFSSVDLSSSLKLDKDTIQTFSFHADSQSKSVSLVGPNGNIALTVDTKNSAILGNSEQQAKALSAYLAQFDDARKRGEGDENLMSLFKSAFTDLNGNNSAVTAAGAAPQRLNAITLSDVDHGMLTGLADFSASISQTQARPNPMQQPAESFGRAKPAVGPERRIPQEPVPELDTGPDQRQKDPELLLHRDRGQGEHHHQAGLRERRAGRSQPEPERQPNHARAQIRVGRAGIGYLHAQASQPVQEHAERDRGRPGA